MTVTSRSLLEEAAGGLSAGIVGTVIGFPLDTLKSRQQTGAKHGMGRTAWNIVQTEGGLALYRGMTPPLISLTILNTYTFATYSFVRDKLGAKRGWDLRNSVAGAVVGMGSSIVSTVENVIKTQLQLDNVQARRYKGSLDALRQLVSNEKSISILYTGHVVNTLREMCFLSVYFGVYESIREILKHYHHDEGYAAMPAIAGGLSGATAWFVSFPLDCVRAGVQGQELMDTKRGDRKSAVTVFTNLMKTKGIRGLYRGVTPSIMRAILVSASRFSAYEGALWLMRGGGEPRI